MILLVDKPKGITSHDVVDRLRKITGERKIGHAGTLDPNATGLLIMGIGRQSTKKLGGIAKNTKKTYQAEIFFGEERDTDDIEGKITSKNEQFSPPSIDKVQNILKKFVGKQDQVPPIFSAIKKGGKKAYSLARKGFEVKLDPRKIEVYSAKLDDYKYPLLKATFTVSSGTYIRALARDIGRAIGAGAYLRELRRTKIGKFSLEDAVTIDELTPNNWVAFVIS